MTDTERKAAAFDLILAAIDSDATPEEVGRRTRQIVWSYMHAIEELKENEEITKGEPRP